MKSFFDYLNSNGALATIIGIILGWLLNFLSGLFMDYRQEKRKDKELKRSEQKDKISNKPELRVDDTDDEVDVSFEVFVGTFKVNYSNNDYEIEYSNKILKSSNLEYKDVVFMNIGKSNIESIDFVSNSKKSIILCEYSSIKTIVKIKGVLYNACYDKKIIPGEKVKIRFFYLKNSMPCLSFSSTISIYLSDENHDYWEQPYFYERDNLYTPTLTNYKKFRAAISTEDAYECFEKPYLW